MLILLFYYEILEFNFLGLNKNTAKSIQMREGNDEESRETISEIELGDQYYVNNNSSRGSNEGLNDISENISFSNKANSPNEKNALLDKNNLNKNNELNLEDGSINNNE